MNEKIESDATLEDITSLVPAEIMEQMGLSPEENENEMDGQPEGEPTNKPDQTNDPHDVEFSPEEVLAKMQEDGEDPDVSSDSADSDDAPIETKSNEQTSQEELHEIVYNGEKQSLSIEQMKELAQKGFDYTQKTQGIAEERKALEDEIVKFQETAEATETKLLSQKQEMNDLVETKQKWDFCIDSLERDQPELYDQLQDYFNQTTRFFNNPVMKSQIDSLQSRIDELQNASTQKEHQGIRDQYNTEKMTLAQKIAPLEKLGIKPDWDAIQSAWTKGQESVEKAFYAVHGADVVKAYKSKAKLARGKDIASRKKKPSASDMSAPFMDKLPKNVDKMSYGEIAQKFAFGDTM